MTPLAVMVSTAAMAVLAVAAAPARAAGPLFTTVTQPAVPGGAATGSGEAATLTSIACLSPGDCVAGGSYRTSAGGEQAMVEAQTGGAWGAPQRITAPAAATSGSKLQDATIDSVSCPAQGACVAVGFYRGSGSGMLVASERNGVWATAQALDTVSGGAGDGGTLDSVSCTGAGDCVAVGAATVGGGLSAPVIATETSGSWSKPSLATPPGGDTESVPTSLSVSCPAAGDCVVAGTDYPASGPQLPFVITQSAGRWQPVETLGPLTGAVADPDQTLMVGAIDCAAVGQCTAVGDDETAGGASGFALVDAGGTFTEVELPYPQGAAGFLASGAALGLDAVACADPGDCAAGGGYPTAGTPTQPAAASMTAVEAGGRWSVPTPLVAPGDAAPATSGLAALRAMSCPAAGQCEAVGGYRTSSGAQVPMVALAVPVLTVSTTSLPVAQVGRRYSAQLASGGGLGPATWSVTAGALPVGLTLDPATGVISGTPRFTQRGAFTVTVSDPGPPAQSASSSFTIRVGTTAPPGPRISDLRVSPRRASLAGRRVGHRCEALTHRDRRRRHCQRVVSLRLRMHLNMAATVRLTATLLRAGREVRHGLVLRCVALHHRNRRHPRCLRPKRLRGHDTLHLRAGIQTVGLKAVLRGRSLGPGTYRLRLTPSADGRSGRAATARITITR